MNTELPMCLLDWIDKDKLDWSQLSRNPNAEAIALLKENPLKIDWYYLSLNVNAIALLKENPLKIDWRCLSCNPCAEAIALLRENPLQIDWTNLSENPCAEAIALLKENPLQIDWTNLSENPCAEAIALLKENPLKIDWTQLSQNPNIFTYDYEKMRKNMLLFNEDLMKERFHPRNLRKFSSWGHSGGIEEDDEE